MNNTREQENYEDEASLINIQNGDESNIPVRDKPPMTSNGEQTDQSDEQRKY